MSITEASLEFGNRIQNELIQIRADQREMGQQLTERINGVANDVKKLSARVDARFDAVDARFDSMDARFDSMDARIDSMDRRFDKVEAQQDTMQATQVEMMNILFAIQRKLDIN